MCKKTVIKMVTRGRGGLHSVSSDFHLVLSSWCEIVQKQRSHINKIRGLPSNANSSSVGPGG